MGSKSFISEKIAKASFLLRFMLTETNGSFLSSRIRFRAVALQDLDVVRVCILKAALFLQGKREGSIQPLFPLYRSGSNRTPYHTTMQIRFDFRIKAKV
ncbi:hypothetical protein AVEN_217323-1 [Araneus ventricosus]|uniref:Uncharacterized protein n=1 Tax=Araneus ventricosus TaxID=182803 RepID=A0A4Y2UYH1_ARAVE|nr:hypothetical protein AVEN_217323-1 [Araneus ventricosus]